MKLYLLIILVITAGSIAKTTSASALPAREIIAQSKAPYIDGLQEDIARLESLQRDRQRDKAYEEYVKICNRVCKPQKGSGGFENHIYYKKGKLLCYCKN